MDVLHQPGEVKVQGVALLLNHALRAKKADAQQQQHQGPQHQQAFVQAQRTAGEFLQEGVGVMHDAVTSQANGVRTHPASGSIGARRPVVGQQLLELIRRHGVGDQEALDLSAVDLTQQRKFLRGFYAFGDYDQAQLTP